MGTPPIGIWNLEADPEALEAVANAWKSQIKQLSWAADTITGAANRVIGGDSWAGETAERYEQHRRKLVADLELQEVFRGGADELRQELNRQDPAGKWEVHFGEATDKYQWSNGGAPPVLGASDGFGNAVVVRTGSGLSTGGVSFSPPAILRSCLICPACFPGWSLPVLICAVNTSNWLRRVFNRLSAAYVTNGRSGAS